MCKRHSLAGVLAACLLLTLGAGAARAQEVFTTTTVDTPASTDLTLNPTQDLVLNPTGNDVLPSSGYDINLGMLTKKFLSLHAAELWVETLVAQNTLATIGGRVLVAPTTLLTADLGSGATSIQVKHNNLANGDRVYMEADGSVEFMAITSGAGGSAGAYTYSVTRNLDGSGANNWAAGDAVLNTGQVGGGGFIDLYSVRGVKAGTEIGPTIVGNVRLSNTYNDWEPRWAIGNLDGLYGYSGTTFGTAFGSPQGTRVTMDPTNGLRMFATSTSTSTRVTLDPTNGLRLIGSDNDAKVTIDMSGNATFDGRLTVGTGKNQVRNANCSVSTESWGVFTNTGLTATLGGPWPATTGTWNLGGVDNDCYVAVTGTPTAGTLSSLFGGGPSTTDMFTIAPGAYYEASAYIGVHNSGNTYVVIQFFDAALSTLLGTSNGNACTTANAGGQSLTNNGSTTGYCRSGVIAAAPSGAHYARIAVQTEHTASLNPVFFAVQMYFGEASSAQEDLTEWSPAGQTVIDGGLIATDAIITRHIAAGSITANEIAAGTITATQIAAGAITGNMITGGTIDGVVVVAGSGDEVTLDSSGISIAAGTGSVNKIKWSDGVTISAPNSASHLYLDGGLTVERNVLVTGTGAGAAAITVSGGFGIAADTLISPSMASSTGTTVIWENACACLKKDSSSSRYKENIRPWFGSGAQRLLNATPIRFDFKGEGEKGVLGLSAEDIYMVAPEAVNLDAEGRPDSVRQGAINAYLLQIIKELRAEVDALKQERNR